MQFCPLITFTISLVTVVGFTRYWKRLVLYFLAPNVLFFSLIWLLWHFLHLVVERGFLPPHLKHILKNSLRCCAICFFAASVIGILLFLKENEGSFLPFYSYDSAKSYRTIRFSLLSHNWLCIAASTNITDDFWVDVLGCQTHKATSFYEIIQFIYRVRLLISIFLQGRIHKMMPQPPNSSYIFRRFSK